ncbi:unnamed protein product [Vitrella brassicaformis CCMP3155]|uniref:Uncharacterized protein n=1 Tax=Vitrella brassicaformis (strain CCMP3155) TaxID=1169540 RepID=A0A0G4FR61_VITBC|nr:unnamed protein product [Vitrella brassicaformis CCMP3155]|eukprot:CEM16721.1 unnamed protein product [Vitrella brassicaformis CCMP3155]
MHMQEIKTRPEKTKIRIPDERGRGLDTTEDNRRRQESVMALVDEVGTSLLDTVEDASLFWSRQLRSEDELGDVKGPRKHRIVVIGSGWSSHAFIKSIDTDKFDVVIISPRNYFLFTPLLAAASVGTVEYRSITEPMRKANPYASYFEGEATDIFPENRTIRMRTRMQTNDGSKIDLNVPYDMLVFSPGVKSSSFGVKGVYENCYFLKEVDDARRLRSAVQDRFERANIPEVTEEEKRRILTFVVCEGGPTGVEFCGELYDLLSTEFKTLYPKLKSLARVVMIQSGPTILPVFEESLRSVGLNVITNAGVEVALETRVNAVGPYSMTLNNGTELPYGLAVWTAGTGPRNITERLIEKVPVQAEMTSRSKKLTIDPWLRVYGTNGSILAMGDCTKMEPILPQTAQVASQQGHYLARMLNRGYDMSTPDNQPPVQTDDNNGDNGDNGGGVRKTFNLLRTLGKREADPFRFFNYGMLAYLGNDKGLAHIQANDLDLIKASGQAGFYLWRSVYFVKQVSLRNRVLVLFDWMKSRMFGRDLSRI